MPAAPPAMPTIQSRMEAVQFRGPGFDTLRLLAASAVVLHHSLSVQMDIVQDDWLFRFSQGYTHLGLFAVCIFFALSGFLVTPGLVRSGDVVEFVSRRFMRIMPLLAVVVTVTALVIGPLLSTLDLAQYAASPATWSYLKNMTTALSLQLPGVTDYDGGDTINDPMWTLRFEWLCYLGLAGLGAVGLLRSRSIVIICFAVCAAWFLFAGDRVQADRISGSSQTLLYLGSYFLAGVVISLFADTLRVSHGLTSLTAVLLVLALALGNGVTAVMAPLLAAYLIAAIGLMRFPWSGLLAGADLSYGIYLSHSVVLLVLTRLWDFTSGLALFAACLPLTAGIALMTWTWIESPSLRHKSLPATIFRRLLQRVPVARDMTVLNGRRES